MNLLDLTGRHVNGFDLATRNSTGNSLGTGFYKSQMDEDFLKASKVGDLQKVVECLQSGVKPAVTNPGGLNALHFAARENHPEVARAVLKYGVDIKTITKRLNTALHIASLGGHTSIVKLLLENGAPIDVQAKDDITPLYMAAQEDHIETVEVLLKHGADPCIAAKGGFEPVDIAVQQGHREVTAMLLEKVAKQGMRALHIAAKKDDKAAIKLLLDEKRPVNDRAPNGYTPLHVAAKFGSVNAANFLIDNGADLNAQAKYDVAPIHVASRHGQTGSISVLIDAGVKLGAATKDGLTALHCAARDGHDDCVELLLVHGAPVTPKTKHGLSALHMAAQGNHSISARNLLTYAAHIDDVTNDGVTALHVSAHYGHVETAQVLLEKGASIDQRALNGYTALHIASKKNREPVVQLLLKKCSVHIKNNNGQTALHLASFFGHVNIVLLLLQAGASVEEVTARGESVLHIACRTIKIKVVRLLLRQGVQIDSKTKDSETPLHIACRQDSSSLVGLLLDNEANPNSVNKEGSTALHIAARDGNEKIVDTLLDHKADVSLTSMRGFTPLHEAAKNGKLEVVQILLERKADINASGKNGLTALHIACHYDQPAVASLLLNKGADFHAAAKNGFTPLHISAKKNQVNIITLLLDCGVEADMTTKHGVSPLHLAAKEGNVETVEQLLDHGASPAVHTTNGLTPLHVAVHHNQIEVVKRLLKYTASLINAPTQTGFMPLHLAASYGHKEMVELLLQSGADVEGKTKNGNTPLHLATVNGHKEVIDLLLEHNAPPNVLNKDGYSALYLAEVTQHKIIIQRLIKITKVKVKVKDNNTPASNRWEKIRKTFLSPEALEETLLIDAGDEIEDESHIKRKSVREDFEESFTGLDDTRSEHSSTLSRKVSESEISVTQVQAVESSMSHNNDDYLNNPDSRSHAEPSSSTNGNIGDQQSNDDATGGDAGYVGMVHNLINGNVSRDVTRLLANQSKGRDVVGRDVVGGGDGNHVNNPKGRVKDQRKKVVDEAAEKSVAGALFASTIADYCQQPIMNRYFVARDYEKIISESSFIAGPPKQGSFLISFNIDARGGNMESKQTGIRITIPPGACQMPTRITCRFRKSDELPSQLTLQPNEHLANRIIQMSPEGIHFLKPVTMEIPHFAVLQGKRRELIVMACNHGRSHWKEHTHPLMEEKNNDEPSDTTVKVVLQEIPDKLAIISRPLKERFVMNPDGGSITSGAILDVSVTFPPKTLNTSTKVVLQAQTCEEGMLPPDENALFSPIVSLDPPTQLSKPININIPCSWLEQSDGRTKDGGSLYLLAWLPKDTNDKRNYAWKNITKETPLSIVGTNVTFSTTEFTRYWAVKTANLEKLLDEISELEKSLSSAPYNAHFFVYGRLLSPEDGELKVFILTDEHSHRNLVEPADGFWELGKSDYTPVYSGQTMSTRVCDELNNVGGGINTDWNITFKPFVLNRLDLKFDVNKPGDPGLIKGIISFSPTHVNSEDTSVCFIDVALKPEMTAGKRIEYPEDTINDDVISMIGQQTTDNWFPLADELGLNKRDKQAIVDLSSGKNDIISVRLLEYWRAKHTENATYKHLHDALKRLELDELSKNVYNASPNEISQDVDPRLPGKELSILKIQPSVDQFSPNTLSGRSSVSSSQSGALSPTLSSCTDEGLDAPARATHQDSIDFEKRRSVELPSNEIWAREIWARGRNLDKYEQPHHAATFERPDPLVREHSTLFEDRRKSPLLKDGVHEDSSTLEHNVESPEANDDSEVLEDFPSAEQFIATRFERRSSEDSPPELLDHLQINEKFSESTGETPKSPKHFVEESEEIFVDETPKSPDHFVEDSSKESEQFIDENISPSTEQLVEETPKSPEYFFDEPEEIFVDETLKSPDHFVEDSSKESEQFIDENISPSTEQLVEETPKSPEYFFDEPEEIFVDETLKSPDHFVEDSSKESEQFIDENISPSTEQLVEETPKSPEYFFDEPEEIFVDETLKSPDHFVEDSSKESEQFIDENISPSTEQLVEETPKSPEYFFDEPEEIFVDETLKSPDHFVEDSSKESEQFINENICTSTEQLVEETPKSPEHFVDDYSSEPGYFVEVASKSPEHFVVESKENFVDNSSKEQGSIENTPETPETSNIMVEADTEESEHSTEERRSSPNPVFEKRISHESNWSTSPTSSMTPESERVPLSPTDVRNEIVSPAPSGDFQSDVKEENSYGIFATQRRESFDLSVATPDEIGMSVSSAGLSDGELDEDTPYVQRDPEIDFSALEELPLNDDTEQPSENCVSHPSPYELSIMRKKEKELLEVQQREEEEEEEEKLRSPSLPRSPVDEDIVVGVMNEDVEAEMNLLLEEEEERSTQNQDIEFDDQFAKQQEQHSILVPDLTFRCATPEISDDTTLAQNASVVSYDPEIEINDLQNENSSAELEPEHCDAYEAPGTEKVSASQENPEVPDTQNGEQSDSSDDRSTPDSQRILNESPVPEVLAEDVVIYNPEIDQCNPEVEQFNSKMVHCNSRFTEAENGFTYVSVTTTDQENVTMTTTRDVRVVTPEERTEITQAIGSEACENQPDIIPVGETVIFSENSEAVPTTTDFPNEYVISQVSKVAVTRTQEVSQDIKVVEIELNPSQENTSEEDLIKEMFGNQQNVLEFFEDENDPDYVGRVDEYGTQV